MVEFSRNVKFLGEIHEFKESCLKVVNSDFEWNTTTVYGDKST